MENTNLKDTAKKPAEPNTNLKDTAKKPAEDKAPFRLYSITKDGGIKNNRNGKISYPRVVE